MRFSGRLLMPGIFSLLLCMQVSAQERNIDLFSGFKAKKEKAVAALKEFNRSDTARVHALIRVINCATFLKERQEVAPYREEAMALSRKLNYAEGIAQCHMGAAAMYKSASDYSRALVYYDSALQLTGNMKSAKMIDIRSFAYHQKGMIYYSQDNYYMALDNFFASLSYGDHSPGNRNLHIYCFITEIYTMLNNLDKATEYAKKSIALAENDKDALFHSNAYFSAIDVFFAKNDLVSAAFYLDKIRQYIPDSLEVQMNFGYYMKRGQLNYRLQRYDTAFAYYLEAYKNAETGGHRNSRIAVLRALSGTALKMGNNEMAKHYALQTLSLTEEGNTKNWKIEALINLSSYYNKKGDNKRAYELLEQAMHLKDSLLSESNIRQINTLTAMYESEKQQKDITRLQNEKEIQSATVKQKTMLNTVFIISIAALLVLGYLGYANFKKSQQIARQQQSLQQQRIVQLEKDKQLLTIDAMLKGQEEERSRIAKDLHDGLGGLLSGTKLSFMNVKENLVLSPDNAVLFDKSLSMLDNTIGDLRKVAQNLMPEALVKFGLHEAVKDFCDSIQSSTGIKVLYQDLGEKRKLDSTAEVFAYRIIQELVNNVVKHAEASQVIVQLAVTKDKIGITVEDNGKGFDKNILAGTKGAGMANIHYRLQYFNGTIDIVTAPGNGTSVNIELNA